MKRGVKYRAFVIFLSILFPMVQAALEGENSGLVAWYKFDEGTGTEVHDSENDIDGVFVGSPQWTTGPTGGAVFFDGFKDYIRIPYNPKGMLSERTVVAWVNIYDNLKSGNGIVSFGRDDPAVPKCYDTNYNAFTYLGILMSYQHLGGDIDRSTAAPYNTWTLGKWDHYAFVYDAGAGTEVYRQVYKNGVLVGSSTTSNGLTADCGLYAIGTQEDYPNPGYVRTFSGKIGEVRVYDRPLSGAEISELYNRVTPSTDRTAPSTITGLAAAAVSSSQIDLSWNSASDNVGVEGYVIYRGGLPLVTVRSLTAYSDVAHSPPSIYRFTVAPSATYSYTVAAFDAAGNYGPQSSSASATTPTAAATGPYTLTVNMAGTNLGYVNSYPSGMACSSGTCTASFSGGASVTLAPYGFTYSGTRYFNGWSGSGCIGNGECQIIMDSNKAVTASYGPSAISYALSVEINGSGSVSSSPAGISCPPSCSSSFGAGTPVTLTAYPSESTFIGWTGACSGTGTCLLPMGSSTSAGAVFGSACSFGADTSGNSVIENEELMHQIAQWRLDNVPLLNLITAISEWKNGC